MDLLITLIFFGLGLIIGSFLNVVIYRLNTDRTFGGRSACMSCERQLHWFELVPLLSFVCLKGRCFGCKSKISWQYPAVEFANGFIFALLFLKLENVFLVEPLNFTLAYAFYAAIFSLFLVIAVYDMRHKIIPDVLALLAAVLALVGLFLFDISDPRIFYTHLPSLGQFLSGAVLSVPFALLWYLSRGRWMGLGDAKLSVSLGWLLGPSLIVSAAMFSFWIAALWGLGLMLLSKKFSMKSELPFGPFLVLGTWLAFFLGVSFPIF